jgi:circadian clock protein KaiC
MVKQFIKRFLDKKEKKEEEEVLRDISSDKYFYLHNGTVIKNVEELINNLKNMDNETFKYHVNDIKNDFSSWIKSLHGKKELAERIAKVKDKEEIIKILEEKSNPLSKEMLKTVNSQYNETSKIELLEQKKPVQITNKSRISNKKENSIKNHIKIGIDGFDELVGKGIPRGISILVCGGPGAGKTIFCLQTLNYSALNGEKCLYMSFEESEERLKQHMKDFGWNPDELEQRGLLRIKKYDPFELSRAIEALLAQASGELLIDINEVVEIVPKDFNPDRIVLDSLSAVSAAFGDREEGYRIYIEQLFNALEKMNVTSFLITEIEQSLREERKPTVEEFLADGIIAFYNIRKGNFRVTAIEVVKIRGVAHKKKIVPFKIRAGKGIEVYPMEEIFSNFN